MSIRQASKQKIINDERLPFLSKFASAHLLTLFSTFPPGEIFGESSSMPEVVVRDGDKSVTRHVLAC